MSKKKYFEKLKDPRWQKTRLKIFDRDTWKCRICDNSEETLHCHHLKYDYSVEPWDIATNSLLTVCNNCHKFIHDVKIIFKLDKEKSKDIETLKYYHQNFDDRSLIIKVLKDKAKNTIRELISYKNQINYIYKIDSDIYFDEIRSKLLKTSFYKKINSEKNLLLYLGLKDACFYLPFHFRILFILGSMENLTKVKLVHGVNTVKAIKILNTKYENEQKEFELLDQVAFEFINKVEYEHIISDNFKFKIHATVSDDVLDCQPAIYFFKVLEEDHAVSKLIYNRTYIKS